MTEKPCGIEHEDDIEVRAAMIGECIDCGVDPEECDAKMLLIVYGADAEE